MRKIALATLLAVSACASNPDNMQTNYTSPMKYSDYSCKQIVGEMDHISRRTGTLYNSLKTKSDNDTWQMGVGLVLLWPTLFFLEGGDGPEAAEYCQLKGDYEAARQALIQKDCPMNDLPPSPQETAQQKQNDDKAREIKKIDTSKGPGGV